MKTSIPSGLPINESSRLLSYLKVKYQPGYFNKCDKERLCRQYGKDPRTINRLLKSLLNDGVIGEDHKAIYLRGWKFITMKKGFNLQSFEASLKEIRDKEIFEATLFAAKLTSIQKAIRKGRAKERKQGCSNQIALSSGFLANACQISTGKVSKLKRIAAELGLLNIQKDYQDFGAGSKRDSLILRKEIPGVFLRGDRIQRRKADQITSSINTYRIKNRKTKPNKKTKPR